MYRINHELEKNYIVTRLVIINDILPEPNIKNHFDLDLETRDVNPF